MNKIRLVQTLFDTELSLDKQVAMLSQLTLDNLTGIELATIAEIILERSKLLDACPDNAVDLVGTGGDQRNSINVSTIAAFVMAGGGVPVAKHGNRSVTSQCGSFDCLQALQVIIPETPAAAQQQLQQIGLTFLFAPFFHEHLKIINPARKLLAAKQQRTIFNILGPLLNPARVKNIVIGVYDKNFIKPMCEALRLLQVQRAYVVHGDGFDEATVFGTTWFGKLANNTIQYGEFTASELGLFSADKTVICGAKPPTNAAIAQQILQGKLLGAATNMVLLNAALGLQLTLNISSLKAAIHFAKRVVDDGLALEKLRLAQEYKRDIA